jgi:tetratricopeptide (TPR) repeat protein
MIGRTLGSYRIVEQIGAGGMASVYKAYDPNTDRFVALKILPEHYGKDSEFYERFRREAKSIANLEHIHILPVHAYGEDNGTAYLVMRYLPTGTLSEHIRKGKLSFSEISRILGQVAGGLDYAHEQGILHRDVKSSNVLLDKNNNAYLTDFGIAGIVEGGGELTGSNMLGTPQYMSPEQCQGARNLTPAADLYSLGVILYEMVTGRVPFRAETPLAVIYMHLNAPLPLPHTLRADLPPTAEQVILKALAKEPGDRYPSCKALAEAFTAAVNAPVEPGEWYADAPPVDGSAPTTQVRATRTRENQDTSTNVRPATAPPAPPRRFPLWLVGLGAAAIVIALLVVSQLGNRGAGEVSLTETRAGDLALEAAMAGTKAAVVTEEPSAAPTDTDEPPATANETEAVAATDIESPSATPTDTDEPPTATQAETATNESEATAQAVANANANPLLTAAEAAISTGNYNDAINAYTQVLETDPDNTDVLLQLGDAYIGNYDYASAIEPFERVTELTPHSAIAFKRLGDAQDGAGDRSAAIESYTHAMSLDPSYLDAQIARGMAYTNEGDYPSAIADLTTVLDADPSSAFAYLQRGNTYATMGSYDEAVADYGQAIALTEGAQQGDDAYDIRLRAYLNRGNVYGSWWDHIELAIPDLTAAVEMSSEGFTEPLMERGEAYNVLQDYENAVADFTEAIDQAPIARAYIGRGEAYMGLENYDSALDDFTTSIDLDNNGYTSAYLDRGDVHMAQGNTERALSDYTSAIGIAGEYAAPGYIRRSVAHIVRQDSSAAKEDLDEALRLEPANTMALTLRGYVNRQNGDYSAALNDYSAALEGNGDFFEALLGRGDVYLSQGDHEEAMADFDRALELEPTYGDILYLKALAPTQANAYFLRGEAQGDLESAIDDYSHAIELDPAYYDAYVRRGQKYVQLDSTENALRDFDAAIEINPDYFWALEQRSNLYASMGRWDDAIEDLTHVIETTPWESVYGYGRRGEIRIAQGDLEGGITDLSIAIITDPDTAWPYFDRAGAYTQLGDTDHALEDYTRVIELEPDNYDAYAMRASVYYDLGEYEKALEDFDAAIEIDPENSWAYNGRGEALDELGRYEEAIGEFNHALEIDSSNAEAYVGRGWAYYAQENYVQAVADFSAALQPDNPQLMDAYAGLGYAYEALGMSTDALRAFRNYQELAGDNADQDVIDRISELEGARATEEVN